MTVWEGKAPWLIRHCTRERERERVDRRFAPRGGKEDSRTLKPILKWVGGKRQLLGEILPLLPEEPCLYVEPFVGGGAVLLAKQPAHARVSDLNPELINVYKVVRDSPEELLAQLRAHKENDSAEHYYAVRALDREPSFLDMCPVERAARIVYLNKTCYNGLYRVNSAGQINSPYGRYKNPDIVNEDGIRALSSYLKGDIEIACGDYAEALKDLPEDSFVYLDPPYMPVAGSATFNAYTARGFSYGEQVRLRNKCLELRERGIRLVESNSDCEAIRELYADFEIRTVKARRAINSKGDGRGVVSEVLIVG